MITKLKEFKIIQEKNNKLVQLDNTINIIKEKLLLENRFDTWEEFIDSQNLGDCQDIVSTIVGMNIDGVLKHFGEIKIIDGIWNNNIDDENDYGDENDYDDDEDDDNGMIDEPEHIDDTTGKIMTHHWITINDEIYEFSKGTLKDYIDWYDIYTIDMDDAWEIKNNIIVK